MSKSVDSTYRTWLTAKVLFDEKKFNKALDLLTPLFEKNVDEGDKNSVLESWFKIIYSMVMIGEIEKAKSYKNNHERLIRQISQRHFIIGAALILSYEKRDPEYLRKASEHFSQAWNGYRYSEYPKLFKMFEEFLSKSLGENRPPHDYTITSYTLWIDGLELLAREKFSLALEKLKLSYERYDYSNLHGDTAWSWYDAIVCHLFMGQTIKAKKLYDDFVMFAKSISSRFVQMADCMFKTHDTKDPSPIEHAMNIIAHGWLGYQESPYPKIFENFEKKFCSKSQKENNYEISAFNIWINGIELMCMSFPQKAFRELEKAKEKYTGIGFKDVVGWIVLSQAISYLSTGNLKEGKDFIASSLLLIQMAGGDILGTARLLLKGIGSSNVEIIEEVLKALVQFTGFQNDEGITLLITRIKSEFKKTQIKMQSIRQYIFNKSAWVPRHKGLRVELSIDRINELFHINLIEPTSVIQGKPITKKIKSMDVEKTILNPLNDLILKIKSVRIGLQLDSVNPQNQIHLLEDYKKIGKMMYYLLMPKSIRQNIRDIPENTNLILKLDGDLLHIPWEIMFDGDSHLCLKHNLSRVISSNRFYVPKITRTKRTKIRFLIVGDPLKEDQNMVLPNARAEAIAIAETLEKIDDVEFQLLLGKDASANNLLNELSSGVEFFHFAGHAKYDRFNPDESILLLSDREISASTLKSFVEDSPPLLAFINACESSRESAWDSKSIDYDNLVFGMASAFLSAGCYYIGGLFPVHDKPATHFAQKFYAELLSNSQTLGSALRQARLEVWEKFGDSDISWASYVFYGDPILMIMKY